MKVSSIVALLCIAAGSSETVQDDQLDKLVNYVVSYINYTSNYVLPENNSARSKVDDDRVYEYGNFDFIVIGAGSSGTILPRRLTENTKFTVLLLEAGIAENNFTNIPAMNAYLRTSPYNWGYKTVPQKNSCLGMNEKRCVYPIGCGLGGSNIIGDMVYARGNKADFDDWAAQGNIGWSYKEVLPYFKKTERDETQDPLHTTVYHGFDGILPVNYTLPVVMNYDQYRNANIAMGLKKIDINGPTQIGFQEMPWTIKKNLRQTGGNAFIQPVLGRKNLNVTLEAFVTKLVIEGDTVKGVQFVKGGKKYIARPNKEVILAAGAINSPQILMLSGIGPTEELKKHNIPVKFDLPVGRNLSDQPVYLGMYIRTNQTAPNLSVPDLLAKWLKNERPLNSVFNAQHISFINTKTGVDPPNVELITINPPTTIPGDLVAFYNLDEQSQKGFVEFNTLTDFLVYIFLMRPQSRGTVTLQSNSPDDFPQIDPAYYTDGGEDLQAMYEAVRFVIKMTATAPLKSINATVVANSPQCEHLKATSDEKYWKCAITHLTSTIYHPTGTTKMGVSPKWSVVDNEFKVHHMKNLRVCDAGSMPSIVSGHPFAAIMMMGDKLADILKKQYT